MTSKITGILLLFCGALLSSCYTRLPLPEGKGQPMLVLQGELKSGDTLGELRIGQTAPLLAGNAGLLVVPENVVFTVREGAGPALPAACIEDAFSVDNFTLCCRLPLRPVPGGVYHLEATAPGMTTATVALALPKAFSAAVTDTFTTGGAIFNATIAIRDAAASTDRYVIEALLNDPVTGESLYSYEPVYISTTDTGVTAVMSSGVYAPYIMLRDASFNGRTREITVRMNRDLIRQRFPGDTRRLILRTKSVEEEYFHFLHQFVSAPVFRIGSAFPINITGNVKDGMGMVGSAYCIDHSYSIP